MVDTTEMAAAGQHAGVLHCLTIPLHDEVALLPNAAIAEIIAYVEPARVEGSPVWLLGIIDWRDKKVPLISFEAASGKDVEAPKKNSRMAILNTLNGNTQLPYVGILSQGIPSLALVNETGIEEREELVEAQKRASVSAIVKLGGVEALIPDIDDIEQRITQLNLT